MTTSNGFYKVLDEKYQSSTFFFEIELNTEHRIFAGHFPNRPITPGVCIIQIVKEIIGGALDNPVCWIQADAIKYLKLIDPTTTPILKFRIDYTMLNDEMNVRISVSNQQNELMCKIIGKLSMK